MVKVIITGSGCPIIHRLDDVKACASEAILIDDDVLLFDCGRHVSSQLLRSGVPPYNVNYLFFTHIFHPDHTSDYPNLLYSRSRGSFDAPLKQLNVFGPKGTIGFTDKLIEAFISSRGPRLMKNISVKDVSEGFVHKTAQWEIECVDTTHGTLFNHLSLGYRITVAGKSIVISGDITMPSLEAGSRDDSYALNRKLIELAENADLFIMDASLSHTTTEGLGRAAKRANVKKVILTHTWEPGIRSRIPAVYSRNPGEIGVQPPFDEFIAEINKIYDGEVIAAEDLKAITI